MIHTVHAFQWSDSKTTGPMPGWAKCSMCGITLAEFEGREQNIIPWPVSPGGGI